MNKRKPLSLVIIILLVFFISNIKVSANSSLDMTKTSITKSGQLIPGVSYESFKATTTNDTGSIANQNISYVKKTAGSNVKVVAWSKISGSSIVGSNIISLAQDFEAKNPGYKVIAGINGDYYDPPTKTPVNALVQNSDMIKFNNFSLPRYFSIGINDSSTDFITSKNNVLESNYVLSIYDETETRVVREVKLLGFNMIPSVNQTSVFYKSLQEYEINGTSMFLIESPSHYTNYGTYFIKGDVVKEVTKTSTVLNQVTIASQDPVVINLLKNNPKVRIQKNLKDVNEGYENIIGVGSQPLKNNVVQSFEDIGDQNVSFASARAPRSSIGFTANGDIIIATMDGRQTNMAGVNLREEAHVMKSLGAVNAFNFDGGGSTQLMIRENNTFKMLNSPSETYRNNSNGILFVVPDVYIEAQFSNLTSSTVDVSYVNRLPSGVVLKNLSIYLNDQLIDVTSNSFKLTNLIEYGINYVSFEATYEKNGTTFTRTFLSKRINIDNKVVQPVPTKVKPSAFTVDFEMNEDIKGFDAIVNFDDPSNTIVKLYLVNNGEKEIAIKDSRGYVVNYKNVDDLSSFSFQVEYHYRINTIEPVYELTEEVFDYLYDLKIPDEEEPVEEPTEESKGCTIFSIVNVSVSSLLMLGFIIIRRRG